MQGYEGLLQALDYIRLARGRSRGRGRGRGRWGRPSSSLTYAKFLSFFCFLFINYIYGYDGRHSN